MFSGLAAPRFGLRMLASRSKGPAFAQGPAVGQGAGVRRPFRETRSASSLGMNLSTPKRRPCGGGGGGHTLQPKMPKVHMSCVPQPLNMDSHSWWDD